MHRRTFLATSALATSGLILPLNHLLPSSPAKPLRIGLLADLHQDIIPDGTARLSQFLEAANRRKLDLIMQLGDFCFPLPKNRPLVNLWQQYQGPSYHLLGNHDMDVSGKKATMDFWGMKEAYYSFDQGGYHLVVLDPNFLHQEGNFTPYENGNFYVENRFRTWVNSEQVEWLAADLRATNLPTIIFSHQSLANEAWGINNRKEIRDLLETANEEAGFSKVMACFNGHNHIDAAQTINGIHYVDINSMSYQWLGEKYTCTTRYPEALYEQYPNLDKIAPYEEPLFAFASFYPNRIELSGIQSQWLGPSPKDLGMPEPAHGYVYSPAISDRKWKR